MADGSRRRRRLGGTAAAAVVVLAVLRRLVRVVTVRGDSMGETHPDGSRVIAVFPPRWVCERVTMPRGLVAVADLATWLPSTDEAAPQGLFVKRIAAVPGDPMDAPGLEGLMDSWEESYRRDRVPPRRYVVLGDYEVSGDSRRFGFMPADALRGVVVWPRRPAAREDAEAAR